MTENEIRDGETYVLARDFDDLPLPFGVAGEQVTVVRIDGHGVLVQNRDGYLLYVQAADLLPFGTLIQHGKPTTLDKVAVDEEASFLLTRTIVILLFGIITVAILFSCYPQGL